MDEFRSSVPGCIEHERLEFDLLELRTLGQYLLRLGGLTRQEQAEWDHWERAALAQLVDHDLEHGAALKIDSGRKGKKG